MCGVVEVADSAGRVGALAAGWAAARRDLPASAPARRRGLRYVVAYFEEMWSCRISAGGTEGVRSVVTIEFPQAVRVRKLCD